jgi:hypothetical protein
MLRTRVYHSRPMRHSVRVRPLVTLICAACTLAIPAAAAASGSSPVHIDPRSPVAKEYALPLASARGAAPEGGKSGSLFGSGLEHNRKPASPKTVTTQAPPKAVTDTETYTATAIQPAEAPKPRPKDVITVTLPDLPTTTATTRTKTTVSAAPAAYQVLRPGSGSGVLWMVLAGVLVVAVGSAGGLALARRR